MEEISVVVIDDDDDGVYVDSTRATKAPVAPLMHQANNEFDVDPTHSKLCAMKLWVALISWMLRLNAALVPTEM